SILRSRTPCRGRGRGGCGRQARGGRRGRSSFLLRAFPAHKRPTVNRPAVTDQAAIGVVDHLGAFGARGEISARRPTGADVDVVVLAAVRACRLQCSLPSWVLRGGCSGAVVSGSAVV